MLITAEDGKLILSGWLKSRQRLKAHLLTPGGTQTSISFGYLFALKTGDMLVHPDDTTEETDLNKSYLLFRLDEVVSYEFEMAHVIERSSNLPKGQLSTPHGDSMLTLWFADDSHINLSNPLH